jgi:hypothetical protein
METVFSTDQTTEGNGEERVMTIYVYSNETGRQVASYTADSNDACEAWVESNYGSNDYHAGYDNWPVSNAVTQE